VGAAESMGDSAVMTLKNLEFDSPRRIERSRVSEFSSKNLEPLAPVDVLEARATKVVQDLFPGFEWRFDEVEVGFEFTYAKFHQIYQGRDVLGADLVLTLTPSGDWTTLSSTAVSPSILEKLGSSTGLEQNDIRSRNYFTNPHQIIKERSVVYVRSTEDKKATAFFAREFAVLETDRLLEFIFWIDESTGEAIGAFQPSSHISSLKIKGTISPDHPLSTPEEVFFPYVSAFGADGKTTLTGESGILTNQALFGNRFQLKLQNETILVFSDEKNFVSKDVDPLTLTSDEVSLDEGPGLEERTIFHWVMTAKSYLKNKFNYSKAAKQINAIARFEPEPDNAFFLPLTYHLAFGAGKKRLRNTGLARSVIIHEFGHSVVYEKYGLIADYEFIAMNEAMADYLSATIINNPIVGENVLQESFAIEMKQNYIRQIDNKRTYPEDYKGYDPHGDGLMFSGALWDLRKMLGAEKADRLIHEAQIAKAKTIHEFYLTLLKLAQASSGSDPWASSPETEAVRKAFFNHGIGARDVVLKKAGPADYTIPWNPGIL